MDYPGGPQVITLVFYSAEEAEVFKVRKDRMTGEVRMIPPVNGASSFPDDPEAGGGGPLGLNGCHL